MIAVVDHNEHLSYSHSMQVSLFAWNQPALQLTNKPKETGNGKTEKSETKAKAKHPILAYPPGAAFGRCEIQPTHSMQKTPSTLPLDHSCLGLHV